jgi:membrane protease YdiL (CAAX protease family)
MKTNNFSGFLFSSVVLFAVFYGLGLLTADLDWTWARILIGLVTVSGVTLARSLIAGIPIRQSFWKIGFGTPDWRTVGITLGIRMLMLAFFPLYASLTDIHLPLQNNWLWILVGIIAGVGIAEEALFRGYVFGFLRESRGFWRAATLSMILFGAMHLLLLLWIPFPIAIAAIILAVISAYPSAYLFENGNRTIWPSAIFHTTALATNLFEIPTDRTLSLSLLWIGVVLIGLVLVFVAGRLMLSQQGFNQNTETQRI